MLFLVRFEFFGCGRGAVGYGDRSLVECFFNQFRWNYGVIREGVKFFILF